MDAYPKARVRLLRKRNGGLADARNVGLTYARGSWLCMLDSDDLLGADYLVRAADLIAGLHQLAPSTQPPASLAAAALLGPDRARQRRRRPAREAALQRGWGWGGG